MAKVLPKEESKRSNALHWWVRLSIQKRREVMDAWIVQLSVDDNRRKWSYEMISASTSCIVQIFEKENEWGASDVGVNY